ncbi:depupylase/deamidase Dop [Corynebacterium kroppenstedtii]|uniref:depupylase/deamidase Dop n=1 Tax=Corynebacterium sp. PCR 32 TaxID=3351342 RepID=UPI00375306B2
MLHHQPRIMGTETEFGISCPSNPSMSPITTSTAAVMAYADKLGLGSDRTRWDYEPESPLRDARGFDLRRYAAHHAPVLDPNAMGAANIIVGNGARFYVDHAHPEYSSPEVTDALSAVIWDKAGDIIMSRAAQAATQAGIGHEGEHWDLKIYKNNVDGKGASYGTHENYLYRRDTDMTAIEQGLIPFFVTRQIMTGAGRVGLGQHSENAGFQISQRADYIETTVSLETTLNRGIINTRDEPHAKADEWRRLHVIIGDANLSEYAQFLKLGTTALVLDAIEAGIDFSDLELESPVDDLHRVSRDLTCTAVLRGADRKTQWTAIDIQRIYHDRVVDAAHHGLISLSDVDKKVLTVWEDILTDLSSDPHITADRLDWTAKYALLDGFRQRGTGQWDDPRLSLIDLQYSDCDPSKGLYHALVRRGRMQTLVDPEDIDAAIDTPPTNTRAWLRGRLITRFPHDILAANWDNLIVGTSQPQRIDLSSLTATAADATYDITEGARDINDVTRFLSASGICEVTPL